ncbi:probable receptor-like protein kinase At1g49730 isoform X3 [Beta vulgaris subsp. vulgaris]|uniref:probable receptor-like protein kinase At1g49730 isoform X3 n=1 Tax=Beta vulgaris subsp. vulgaris TaxID=3555 RepID=UPI002036B454|nr:probable receptor-like protein kinase At1g49730 isoform X3 [Beta vulgaris subsp. vulgaris]
MNSAFTISSFFFVISIFILLQLFPVKPAFTGCPLNLSGTNFTLVASICSNPDARGKCCRHINAYVALSIARYANATSNLGVSSDLSEVCLQTMSQTLALYGVPANATTFCRFGTKIPINYECKGRTSVAQMLQSPGFTDVADSCQLALSGETGCRRCINASLVYLRQRIVAEDNITLITCRDATFVTLASQSDNVSAVGFASCFFGVPRLRSTGVEIFATKGCSAVPGGILTSIISQGISKSSACCYTKSAVIGHIRKSRELDDSENGFKTYRAPSGRSGRRTQDGPGASSMFREFNYKDTRKATNNFSTIIGQGGFGTVYKAEFSDGVIVAVKQMNKVSEQAEDEFCREIELLARLHHRHLVALRGFCIQKEERFLMYEYMKNGSLKDHLHTAPDKAPLCWQTRIQIAIDVANALEYLHFYCDPPLCHRDIKSSNILLDENFVAKLADFGLAYAAKDGSICFEPINTEVRGTPGYMDPEYVVTRELTEKSDVYSYGVVLLELVTGRRAIQDNRNLVEWAQVFLSSETKLSQLMDPKIGEFFDYDQLQTVVTVIKWCTHPEARGRPSIKQVLRLLYESSDPLHSDFIQNMQDEEYEESQAKRPSKGKMQKTDNLFHSGEGRYLASSSSTTRSYCSRNFLLENGSPQSPPNIQSP